MNSLNDAQIKLLYRFQQQIIHIMWNHDYTLTDSCAVDHNISKTMFYQTYIYIHYANYIQKELNVLTFSMQKIFSHLAVCSCWRCWQMFWLSLGLTLPWWSLQLLTGHPRAAFGKQVLAPSQNNVGYLILRSRERVL